MTISRAQMGAQTKGGKMKKPKKMKNGGKLAMFSPAAALMESLESGKAEGILGMTPLGALANKGQKGKRKEEATSTGSVTGMKGGGKVSRGDGACMKGRTKGKMR